MTDFDRESMLEIFIFEMSQLIDQLEATIVQSESEYNSDQINEIFRIMHTIKGSSAMMMYDNIVSVAHVAEDLFYYLREESPEGIDFGRLSDYVLSGSDFVKAELAKLQEGLTPDGNGEQLAADIEAFLAELKNETPAEPAKAEPAKTEVIKPDLTTEDRPASKDFVPPAIPTPPKAETIDIDEGPKAPAGTDGKIHTYEAKVKFQDGCEMENIRAFTLIHNLSGIGRDIVHFPQDIINEASIQHIREDGFVFEFTSDFNYEYINNHLDQTIYMQELLLIETTEGMDGGDYSQERPVEVETPVAVPVETSPAPIAVVEPTPEPAKTELPEPETATPAPTENKPAKQNDSEEARAAAAEEASNRRGNSVQSMISVNVGKLNSLLNIMSELVMSEAMVTQNPDLEGLQLDNFDKEVRHLQKIISNLRQTVMSMRMVPVSATFFKMHRIVRDMCRQLGKEVQLDIVGEDTEVDKNIIEQIADPIMHIIRNSIDHGIEPYDDRVETGKPLKARVLLEARIAGGDALIIIKDDGRGINIEKVMQKARENGLLTKPEHEYTDKEIQQFIFLPGFSTNEKVTAFSGRGVGMDVVSSNLSLVGGSILVDSVVGEGTTFTLKIPQTIAIIDGMSILVAGTQYTIPIVNIIKSFKAKPDKLFTDPNGNEMITERGEVYNIVRLHEFFNIEGAVTNIEDGTLVMLEKDDRVICLLVDKLVGQQQVVLKPMPSYFKKVSGLGGCTLLGNGDISLIIDVPGFFE